MLGPVLWNTMMDILLARQFPESCCIIAYPEDLTLAINADSRVRLEILARLCIDLVYDWATRAKLGDILGRNPSVRIGGDAIARTSNRLKAVIYLARGICPLCRRILCDNISHRVCIGNLGAQIS